MDQQRQKLDLYLQDWKGHYPQLDDILIVGLVVGEPSLSQ